MALLAAVCHCKCFPKAGRGFGTSWLMTDSARFCTHAPSQHKWVWCGMHPEEMVEHAWRIARRHRLMFRFLIWGILFRYCTVPSTRIIVDYAGTDTAYSAIIVKLCAVMIIGPYCGVIKIRLPKTATQPRRGCFSGFCGVMWGSGQTRNRGDKIIS